MSKFKELDPLLHQQLRLGIMSLLISVKEAEFGYIKDKTKATAGNLSAQLTKLKDENYINMKKEFRDNFPLTTCRITNVGIKAFDAYVKALKSYTNLLK